MNNEELEVTIQKMNKLQAKVASADSADWVEYAKTMVGVAVIALLEIAKQTAVGNMEIDDHE